VEEFKMRLLVWADPHIYAFKQFAEIGESGLNSRLEESLDVLELIVDRANQDDVDAMIMAGDLWHEKHRANLQCVYETLKILENLTKPSASASGNHDALSKAPGHYSALELVRFIQNTRCVIDEYGEIVHGIHFECVPFSYNLDWQLRQIEAIEEKEKSILITHGDVIGQYYGSFLVTEGLPLELLGKFALSVVGHYHTPTIVAPDVLILGAPMQHMWSDKGQKRGIWLVDINPDSLPVMTFEEITSSKFIEVNLDLDENRNYSFNFQDFYRIISSKPIDVDRRVKATIVSPEVIESEARSEMSTMDDEDTLVERYAEARGGENSEELTALGKRFIPGRGDE